MSRPSGRRRVGHLRLRPDALARAGSGDRSRAAGPRPVGDDRHRPPSHAAPRPRHGRGRRGRAARRLPRHRLLGGIMPAIDHLARGTDHIAYPTFDPVATVRFYHDVLGFPIAHAITAKGWGQANHPDFVHFFFDIGNGDRLAFFYYFGLERRIDDTPYLLKHSARHLAIHVDSVDDLGEYDRRLKDS